jgi:signal transduction histidine kinase
MRQTMEGKPAKEVLPTGLLDWLIPYYEEALRGHPTRLERVVDDSVYALEVLPVRNEDGEIFAGMSIIQDITERKQAENALNDARNRLEQRVRERTADLKSANIELSTFTYIVSHDLRSPLVNLKGFAAELRSSVDIIDGGIKPVLSHLEEPQVRKLTQAIQVDIPEALSYIDSAVGRMDHLTSAVLKLSRLGRRELNFEKLNMTELVQALLNSMAHQIKQAQVKATVGELPPLVADRLSMEQIMGNILSNAVLYLDPARPGEVAITGEVNGDETIFHIKDNGRGITDEDKHKIFEPFRRAGKQDVAGEGMGLAYVQTLVRRHGGRIWYESSLDQGTTFSFTIAHDYTKGNVDV